MIKEKDKKTKEVSTFKWFMKQKHIIPPGKDYTLASEAFGHLEVC